MLKLFYALAVIWLLIVVHGDWVTDARGLTALLIFLLVGAVLGINQRIALAVRQIQDRNFDAEAENKREWRFVTGVALIAIGIGCFSTLGSVWQCSQNGDSLSADCIWRGIVDRRTIEVDHGLPADLANYRH